MGEWVVFDYGGVLCRDRSEADRRGLAELAGVADVAGWSHPYEATLQIAARLAEDGTKLALLSNCPPPMADAIDTMSWTDLIPQRFYSCRLGTIKPDPATYTAVLAEIRARPADVTFVDDRPVNVAGARAVGMRALLFTDPAVLAADLDLQEDQ